ncbi:MAG: hypothetical protein AAFQ22_15330 [Pseudomonadota bacterium]
MAKETETPPEEAPRDEDSMYYLVTFLWGMMAWIISGNPVYGVFGALLGWMVDEYRATRRRAAQAEARQGEDGE